MTMKSAHYKRKGVTKSSSLNTTKSEMKKQLDSDSHFCYNMTILIGSGAELETRDGNKYDGVFVAFSGQQEIMLEAAHMIQDNTQSTISKHFDSLIVPSEKVAAVTFRDVDLTYATRDFQTDGQIAGARGLPLGDKEIIPWDGADTEPPEGCYLDAAGGKNGWEVRDMFKKNAENFGVVSSFSKDLAGYTTKLDTSDLETFKRHEEQAIQVALEIEGSAASMDRVKLENVECEEEAFSAVVRVRETPSHPPDTGASSGNGKYIPPSKRQSQYGIESAAGSHNQPLNGSAPQGMGGGMATKKPLYGSSVRGNFPPNQGPPGSYHNDRRQHDTRRPPPNVNQQRELQSNHQDARRSDEGNSLNKPTKPMKGRPDMAKTVKGLHEFHANFNLQISNDRPQNKRTAPMHQPMKPVYGNKNQSSASMNANQDRRGPAPDRSDESGPSYSSVHGKPKDESHPDSQKPQPDAVKPTEVSEPVKPNEASPQTTKTDTFPEAGDNSAVPVDNTHLYDTKETPAAMAGEPKSGSTTPGSDDLKSRKFTFNPHAKEFNPSARAFNPKSPTTPPRPHNDPSSNAQVLGPSSMHTYIPMQALLYNPQTGMVQGPSPPAPTGNPQRNVPHRKGGLIGVAQRAEMPQQMSLQQTVPSLIGSSSLQPNGSHSHYAVLPYSQVRLPNPNMLPLYTEAGGQQVQLPVHYYQHGGSPTQPNSSQHTQPGNTVSVSVPNLHGYAQTHHGYPFLGIQMGWNPAHNNSQQVVASAYVPHGGAGGIPHG